MLLAGCGRPPSPITGHLAILPADVLIGDPAGQWLATAVPLVLQQDLATSASLFASYVPNTSTAYELQSTQILRTVVEQRNHRYRIQATVTSLSTQQDVRVLTEEGELGTGLIPLLDALAKKLDPARATAFSTRNDNALKSFADALSAPDVAVRTQLLNSAVQADSSFGLAQIARLENAPQLADSPPVQDASFTPLDRVRWIALLERLHRTSLQRQAEAEAAVIQLSPNNAEALAILGTERFLQSRASEGESLLNKAIALNPANLNLRLQLAQGLVAVRQFSPALLILNSLTASSPNLLLSVALVELMRGNATEADRAFNRFLSFLPPGNPALPALNVQWQKFKQSDPQPLAAGTDAPSISLWQTTVQQSGPGNLAARAMLAHFLEQAGRSEEARQLHLLPFIPEFTDANAPVAFHEMKRLALDGK